MTNAELWLFSAVLAQIALTAVLYLALVRARFSVPKAELRPEMAYDQAAWPTKARQVSNAVISQFELPVLFYAGALFAFVLGAASWTLVALAWAFVATRVVHAVIHTGKNVIMPRFFIFLAGFLLLIAFWIALAVRALGA
ncbi:MAPEG family protein [Amphiplicatus metriothermophilus]|uniref:MAPEG family protein n=1 Tax=Amphiplicatus metriothermophilus TaxID=1519374 RepID=A0A239PX17_9PROT|nr:MAPEG family protein [Amphiplicatus metriothermophilus]MBB5519933.1 hypothetical protein [Amphiplicatus metriothermophilus]SNT74834.1 hypothetical protein SAMN06297382_2424 [Amphiplicatus metriothermophilus]